MESILRDLTWKVEKEQKVVALSHSFGHSSHDLAEPQVEF